MSGPCVAACAQSWCHGAFKDILQFSAVLSTGNQRNYSTRGSGLFYPAPLSHLCRPASINTTGHGITRAHCGASHAPATHWTLSLCLSCRHLKFCFKCLRLQSACNKTCMLNLLVCTSQWWTGWHPCILETIPCLHELAFVFFLFLFFSSSDSSAG